MPVNATTAGTATAVAATDTTIEISMPYSVDGNADNSYTVEYKLSASATWLDWGTNPKAHTATPYTDTITGLTAGENHDVRLTYNDADGVSGTNPQTISSIVMSANATAAGAATAVAASETAIKISMPYTVDGNANNTYTVEYKLGSEHTVLDWTWVAGQPEGPCRQPVYGHHHRPDSWGQAMTVRLTYTDPDGVNGTNPRIFPNIALPVYATTAGTATAVAVSNQEMAITMPYTGDGNDNNSYTVAYKLTSESTWTNVPGAHTASPYTITLDQFAIALLNLVSVYDVTMTYIDADGVSGNASQSTTIRMPVWRTEFSEWGRHGSSRRCRRINRCHYGVQRG